MSKIPAVKLQQLMGLDEYELTLAIDRVATETGLTAAEVQAELDSVEAGSSGSRIDSAITPEVAKSTSIFSRTEVEEVLAGNTLLIAADGSCGVLDTHT